MRLRLALAALAFAAMPCSAFAPELEIAFAAATQAAKDAHPAREFYLESRGYGWRLRPDPNPPGSELTISVKVGEHVKLHLYLLPGRGLPQAGFDVDGIEAIVNGEPSDGIHVLLRSAPEEAVVEFTGTKEGLHLIEDRFSPRGGRVGLIIIRKR